GVILNRVASPRHLALITPGFERVGLKVFGALGHDARFELPERHFCLAQATESDDIDQRLDPLADAIASTVDLSAVRRAAAPAKPMAGGSSRRPPGQRIAVARGTAVALMYTAFS